MSGVIGNHIVRKSGLGGGGATALEGECDKPQHGELSHKSQGEFSISQ